MSTAKTPKEYEHIPTEEVVKHRKEALEDLVKAYLALRSRQQIYDGDDAVFRVNANLNQLKVIDSILIYRGWTGVLPCL